MSGREPVDPRELLAPCGMDCAHCRGYLDFKYGRPGRHCSGCRPRDKHCAFLKQRCPLLKQSFVRYCFECQDFPCEQLLKLERRYRRKGWPNSFVANLERIREVGEERFSDEQRLRFACPRCGGETSLHDGLCYACGATSR